MNKKHTVYCVIPVHNRLEITKRCLGYLCAQDYPNLRIVIIDDGSTDGTGQYLKQTELPQLTVINGDGNLWWGGAMHLGIKYVIKHAGKDDFLLMLNDDVHVEKHYVSTLVEECISYGGAVVGSTQCDEKAFEDMHSGYRIDYWAMRMLPVEAQANPSLVDAVPGRGALFPLNAILSVGNINFKFFRHYFGDLDYSARVREAGWKIVVSEKAKVYTSSESSDKLVRSQGILKEYFSFRSKNNLIQRLLFFSMRGPYWLRIWAIPRYFLVGGFRLYRRGCNVQN